VAASSRPANASSARLSTNTIAGLMAFSFLVGRLRVGAAVSCARK
jgi:hypothetical protein